MTDEFKEDAPLNPADPHPEAPGVPVDRLDADNHVDDGLFSRWFDRLLQLGLGEPLLRAGTTILSISLIVLVIWLMEVLSNLAPLNLGVSGAQAAEPTPTAVVDVDTIPAVDMSEVVGISRQAQLHTNVPSRPRVEIITYIVQEGDTIFGIAEKFNLQPETVLWANYGTLLDDPHSLKPGQELIVLPGDGVYHQWVKENQNGLICFAKFFNVEPDVIVNAPANQLDPETIGDLAAPNISDGTWLFVPGGTRGFISWSAPLGVTRENPASARVLGSGWCEPVIGGAVGYGTYVYPTNKHFLSGYDYSTKANHNGIDLAGSEGEGVYAADAGVVVYSGWNNYGYGNVVMVDHGNGWQTLYAHLSAIYRGCGVSVGQGEGIGAIGSTGRSSGAHLHFEILSPGMKVNPWDYLPPP